jgi:hypothetical protein
MNIKAYQVLSAFPSIPVVPKRCVAAPWCVGRDHEVCREIKKIFKLRLMMIINN